MAEHGPLSPRNPRVTAARRLSQRSARTKARQFLAEGPQAVREALAGGHVVTLYVDRDGAARHPDLVVAAQSAGVAVHELTPPDVAALAGTVSPQGLVAVCRFVDVALADALDPVPRLVAVLAEVRDPGNLGTVVRVADAAGAGAAVTTHGSVDPYNGKAVRASAGSLFHLPLVVGVPVEVVVEALRGAGLQVLAADGAGPADLDVLADDGSLDRPTAWLFGNEAWGLPQPVRRLADAVVAVPIHGRAESLNLATAAAVCLYASARAQRAQRTQPVQRYARSATPTARP
jgi:TrmH family RNA methyltransferase